MTFVEPIAHLWQRLARGTLRFRCQECGAELQEHTFRDGTVWMPSTLASYGRRRHKLVLCFTHYIAANRLLEQAQGR